MSEPDRPTPPGVPRPTLSPRAAFRRLPEGASIEQLLHAYHEGMAAYANLAVEFRDMIRKLEERVEVVSAEVVVLGAAVQQVSGRVTALELAMATEPGDPPPMRPKLSSNSDLARAVGRDVAARIEAEARNPTTPPPDAATMAQIAEETVKAAFQKVKADSWDRIENERKAAEKDRRDSKLKLVVVTVTTTITTLGAVVTALVEHFTRHH